MKHIFKSVQICVYADNIAIIARDMASLKNMYKMMEQEARKVGLTVNEGKTKYVVLTSGNLIRAPLKTNYRRKKI